MVSREITIFATYKRSILGGTSAIQASLIAFGLHEHCTNICVTIKFKSMNDILTNKKKEGGTKKVVAKCDNPNEVVANCDNPDEVIANSFHESDQRSSGENPQETALSQIKTQIQMNFCVS